MIRDAIEALAGWMWCWILTGIITAANLIIAGLAAFVAAGVALLPDMPEPLEVPDIILQGFLYVRYVFPVDFFVTLLVMFSALWLLLWIISIPLKWGKADG